MTTKETRNHFLKRISEFFINNYKITIILMIGILFFGLYSIVAVRRDGFPQINVPVYIITSAYPGASASDIEEQIITPVEKEIQDIDGIQEFQGIARNNFGTIVATIDTDADFEAVKAEIKSKAEKAQLPEDAEDLEFSEAGFNDQPFMYIGMVGGDSFEELQERANLLSKKIEKVGGIKKVEIQGERDEIIVVEIDLEKAKDQGISSQDIKEALVSANVDFPAGQIEREDGVLPIETKGKIESIDEIKNIEIQVQSQNTFAAPKTIKIEDVATVEKTRKKAEQSTVAGSRSGDTFVTGDAILLGVVKQESKDLIDISRDVNNILEEKDSEIFSDQINYFVGYDTADSVNEQITDLTKNALLGSVVIILVLSLFVSLRGSIVAAVAIPLVLLITFGIFNFIGYSFNTITLFSLLITLGLLVDNAIVIVEGIQHNLENGLTKKEAAIKSVADVGPAVFAATLTTFLVFIPLSTFPGVTGQFIRYIPITIIISILSSFIVAILITPFIGRVFMNLSKRQKARIDKRGMHNPFISWFGGHLSKNIHSIPRTIAVIILSIIVLFSGLIGPFASGKLSFEMWPTQDDAEFAGINLEFPTGSKEDQRKEIMLQVINDAKDIDEIKAIIPINFSNGGGSSLTVALTKDRERNATEVVENINQIISEKEYSVPQGEVEVKAELLAEGPPQAEFEVVVRVFGDDIDKLKEASKKITEELQANENIELAENTVTENAVKKVSVNLDKQKIKDQKAQSIVVAASVRPIFSEEKVTEITESNSSKEYEVYLQYADNVKDSLDDVKAVPVPTANGVKNLEELATIEEVEDARSIAHLDGQKYIEINLDTKDGQAPIVQQYVQNDYFTKDKFKELGIPEGYVDFGGQSTEEMEEMGNLVSAFIIAMLLVYIVLVAQFKSFMQPALIALSVLFSLAFVFPGLVLTGNPLSFFAMLGIIALIGIVVNDSIVLIDAINRFRSEDGMKTKEAIVEGIKQRFKPILATSLTTIAGVLPLALANPFMSALGYALVFGLVSSTIFTLYTVPVMYAPAAALYERVKNRKKKK